MEGVELIYLFIYQGPVYPSVSISAVFSHGSHATLPLSWN